MELTKFEAAQRQLDTAIQMHFDGGDAVAVRTLVGAAGRILSDLVEHAKPGQSWRSNTVKSIPQLPAKDVYAILDQTQNFLKHADRDPHAVELFNADENDALMFLACLECGELGGPLSLEMQVFEVWYIACRPERFGPEFEHVEVASFAFPKIESLPRSAQLAAGREFLEQSRKEPANAI